MKLVEAAWLSYRERVIPSDAPSVQLQECRRAFYAGAWGFYTELMRLLDPGAEVTPVDRRTMVGVVNELKAFNVAVKEGRA